MLCFQLESDWKNLTFFDWTSSGSHTTKKSNRLPLESQVAVENNYKQEPSLNVEWPSDEEAKFKWISSEILSLNKEGAKVRVKAQIAFIKYHYETECTVRWNENISETKIKNASITAV